MAWDTSVSSGDIIASANHNDRTTEIKTKPKLTTGAGVPSSTPSNIGDLYVDTSNIKLYFASGTSSSSDWKKVLSQ